MAHETLNLIFGQDQEAYIDWLLDSLGDKIVYTIKTPSEKGIHYDIGFITIADVYLFGYKQAYDICSRNPSKLPKSVW